MLSDWDRCVGNRVERSSASCSLSRNQPNPHVLCLLKPLCQLSVTVPAKLLEDQFLSSHTVFASANPSPRRWNPARITAPWIPIQKIKVFLTIFLLPPVCVCICASLYSATNKANGFLLKAKHSSGKLTLDLLSRFQSIFLNDRWNLCWIWFNKFRLKDWN